MGSAFMHKPSTHARTGSKHHTIAVSSYICVHRTHPDSKGAAASAQPQQQQQQQNLHSTSQPPRQQLQHHNGIVIEQAATQPRE
mmetsp:Transcript_3076/g.8704  ORF Transcript_3076/g.8704 Transcript_3076/m.8704 type:complete len:84 (-) Transcript_3076:1713-1964(-)